MHKATLFKPLENNIDTLPESIRQSQKDTLKKGIGDLDDVEAHLRWTEASGTPRAALQAVTSEIFTPVAEKTGKPAQELANEIAEAGAFFQDQLGKPIAQVSIGDICRDKREPIKSRLLDLQKDFKEKGTAALSSLQKDLSGTLFFKAGDLIDGQPRFSVDGYYRYRQNATGPDERSLELRFEMGTISFWGFKRFAAGKDINPALLEEYLNNKSDSAPSFSAIVNYTKTSDFKIPLPVDATEFHQAEASKLTATLTGGLYFGGGRSHRLELKANYDDISDDPTRQNRFVSTLSWVEKLNSTLTQALGGSDLTVTFIYANKPEFRGEVQHDLGLRAGLKWSVGGTSTK